MNKSFRRTVRTISSLFVIFFLIFPASGTQTAAASKNESYLLISATTANTQTSAPEKATAIDAGGAHACAVTTNGAVKCWGWNEKGQLGDGTTINRWTPVNVAGLSSGVSMITTGFHYTCALTNFGGVKCWGWNYYGQLGDGTYWENADRSTPVDVIGLSSGVSAVTSGDTHACALTTTGGVQCWGWNSIGQLGNGTTSNTPSLPVPVIGLSSGVSAIAASLAYTCALTTIGGVKCWGSGPLGNGTTTVSSIPVDVMGLSSGVVAIAMGPYHSCALTTAGSIKCWGHNPYGELGDGTYGVGADRSTPVDVVGLPDRVVAINAGYNQTCALIIVGGVKCWGRGPLGNGTTAASPIPVDVKGSSGVSAIEAGVGYTCVLRKNGGVKCWGRNNYGQLGDGTTTDRLTPVNVVGFVGDAPVILVHGWQGLASGYTCSGIQRYDGSNSTLNPDPALVGYTNIADWLQEDGYDVWIAHLSSNAFYTDTLEQNAKCLRSQIETVWQDNPQAITMVAHSMGGLVSRAAIRALSPDVKIDQLFTLGTPHAGIPLKVLTALSPISGYCKQQPAVCEMSTSNMSNFFNKYNPNINSGNLNYYFIGGNGGSGFINSLLKFTNQGENDGLVGRYSAIGWIYPSQVFDPYNWASTSLGGQYFTGETHPAPLSDSSLAYYVALAGQVSESYQCIRGLMQEPPSSQNCQSAASQSFQLQSANTTVLSSNQPSFTEIKTGHLDAGQEATLPFDIDSTGVTMFYLNWIGGNAPSLTLTRPDAQVIDPTYMATFPAEGTYETGTGSSEAAPSAVYNLVSGQIGAWQATITATDAIDYKIFGLIESSLSLETHTDAEVYQVGNTVTITADLNSSGAGLSAATVTAALARPDNVVDAISLIDQGNGTYTNTYMIPDAPGYLTIDVTATGSENSIAFSRQDSLLVAIAPNNLQLTDSYNDQPRDVNSDGLYEFLDFSAEVTSTTAREYVVSVELYAGDQLITQSADYFDLSTGPQTVTLSFDGSAIQTSGLNGPYTVKNLNLIPLDIGIPAASVENAWTTPAYSHNQFGLHPCYLLTLNHTGSGSDPAALPTHSDGCTIGEYVESESIDLISSPDTGWSVYSWQGADHDISTSLANTLTMPSNNQTVIVNYGPNIVSITGNVGISGTTLSYEDGGSKTITADNNGDYMFEVSSGWSGTVTPSKIGYTFTPVNRSYLNVIVDQTNQDYIATPITSSISGNAGVGNVTLSYVDGTSKTAISDAGGNYSFTVSWDWSGTVTPVLGGYVFNPPNISYAHVTSDQTNQNYTARKLDNFLSNGVYDGWILESAETSSKGGSLNSSATTLIVGDDVKNKQYKSILSFDTSSIPDNAVITSVVLRVKRSSIVGTDPFTTHNGLTVDISKPYFGSSLNLVKTDFQALASANQVGTFDTVTTDGWYSVSLTATAYPFVNLTGGTQLRLQFSLDDNNDKGADYIMFYSGNATVLDRPVLIIQYYVP